jgi:hypothetical protein
MEPEGMVRALEGIGRLLRPDGALIDIHPVAEAPLLEVWSGDEVVSAEPYPGYDYEDDLRHAEDALSRVVGSGSFAMAGSRGFDFLIYGSSFPELRDFLQEAGAYDDTPEDDAVTALKEELAARVEGFMTRSHHPSEVAYHERGRMTRLLPLSGSTGPRT